MLALPSRFRQQRRPRAEPKPFQLGASLGSNTLTFIPKESKIRPLRDQMIVEPTDKVYSRYLVIPEHGHPIKGIVRAIGPGTYPRQYDHPEKHKRTKMWHGMGFRPCDTKVGDHVWIGGFNHSYAFEQFWHGDTLMLHCREEDVVGVEYEDLSG